jgi:Cof subfamily protein (haloacid dehalogenase superfamily)
MPISMQSLVDCLRPGGRFDEWQGRPVRGVFLDVDGTVLGEHPQPTSPVVAACLAGRASGLRLGFATGRAPAGLDGLRTVTGAPGPHVAFNGAAVLRDGGLPQIWPLPVESATDIARWCLARGVYAEFVVNSGFVVTEYREAARPSWDTISGDPDGLVTDVDLTEVASPKVTVNAFEPELLPELLALCDTLGVHADRSTAPIFPGVTILNITAAGIDKGFAVAWAARDAGLSPEELMVVGDGDNDLSMFRVAGTAVAMGQAPEHVKAEAHLVTGSFAEDGAATALTSIMSASA